MHAAARGPRHGASEMANGSDCETSRGSSSYAMPPRHLPSHICAESSTRGPSAAEVVLFTRLSKVDKWEAMQGMAECSPRAAARGPRHGASEVTNGSDCETSRDSSSYAVPVRHPPSHICAERWLRGPSAPVTPSRNLPGYVGCQVPSALRFASPEEVPFRQPEWCPMDCVARGCRSKCTFARYHWSPHVCPRHHYLGGCERDQDDPEDEGMRYDEMTRALFEYQAPSSKLAPNAVARRCMECRERRGVYMCGCRRLLCDHPECCRIIKCCWVSLCRWCYSQHLCPRPPMKPRHSRPADDTETDSDSDSENMPRSRSSSGELAKDEPRLVLTSRPV